MFKCSRRDLSIRRNSTYTFIIAVAEKINQKGPFAWRTMHPLLRFKTARICIEMLSQIPLQIKERRRITAGTALQVKVTMKYTRPSWKRRRHRSVRASCFISTATVSKRIVRSNPMAVGEWSKFNEMILMQERRTDSWRNRYWGKRGSYSSRHIRWPVGRKTRRRGTSRAREGPSVRDIGWEWEWLSSWRGPRARSCVHQRYMSVRSTCMMCLQLRTCESSRK